VSSFGDAETAVARMLWFWTSRAPWPDAWNRHWPSAICASHTGSIPAAQTLANH